jgi:hypothetical protein
MVILIEKLRMNYNEDAPEQRANKAVQLPPSGPPTQRPGSPQPKGPSIKLRGIADQRSCFINCLNALPEPTVVIMDQISIKTPNPKCRLFLN